MAVAHRIDETAYEQFVLSGAEGAWELHDGRLVEKPGMTWEHGDIIVRHVAFLYQQLNEGEYRVRANEGRLRRSIDTVFIPDLLVVPTEYGREWRGRPGTLAIFSPPVPLVVDVWSESTGGYDVDAKISVYRQRGDLEIWRIHPFERTLTRWVRQPDGTYRESVHVGGTIELAALPGVKIDLDRLLAS
jgi:Uma2 family endonuclease